MKLSKLSLSNGGYAYMLVCTSLLSLGLVMYELFDFHNSSLTSWNVGIHAENYTIKQAIQEVVAVIKNHDKIVEKLAIIQEDIRIEEEEEKLQHEIANEKARLREKERVAQAKQLAEFEIDDENDEEKEQQESLNLELGSVRRQIQETEFEVHGVPIDFAGLDYDDDGMLQPAGSKIVMVTASDKEYRDFNTTQHEQMMLNRQDYAKMHGYEFVYVDSTEYENHRHFRGRPKMWRKIASFLRAYDEFPDAEWFWWLDADAIIMNKDLSLAQNLLHPKALQQRIVYGSPLLDANYNYVYKYPEEGDVDIEKIDLIISQDDLGLNAGGFLLRRSEFADMFLHMWNDNHFKDLPWKQYDQSVIQHLLIDTDGVTSKPNPFLSHVGLVTQRSIQSYRPAAGKEPKTWLHYQEGDFVIHFAGIIQDSPLFTEAWDEFYALSL